MWTRDNPFLAFHEVVGASDLFFRKLHEPGNQRIADGSIWSPILAHSLSTSGCKSVEPNSIRNSPRICNHRCLLCNKPLTGRIGLIISQPDSGWSTKTCIVECYPTEYANLSANPTELTLPPYGLPPSIQHGWMEGRDLGLQQVLQNPFRKMRLPFRESGWYSWRTSTEPCLKLYSRRWSDK